MFSLLIDFHVRSVVNLASFAASDRRTRRTQSNTLKVLHAIFFNEIIKTFIWTHISLSLQVGIAKFALIKTTKGVFHARVIVRLLDLKDDMVVDATRSFLFTH